MSKEKWRPGWKITRLVSLKIIPIISVLFTILLIIIPGVSCQSQTTASIPPAPGMPPSEEPVNGQPASTPLRIEVTIEDFNYKPASLNIPVGSTVTWQNNDSVIHTVTARDGSFSSGSLSKGNKFSQTFKEKGSFEYYCIPHPYMTGEIIVE